LGETYTKWYLGFLLRLFGLSVRVASWKRRCASTSSAELSRTLRLPSGHALWNTLGFSILIFSYLKNSLEVTLRFYGRLIFYASSVRVTSWKRRCIENLLEHAWLLDTFSIALSLNWKHSKWLCVFERSFCFSPIVSSSDVLKRRCASTSSAELSRILRLRSGHVLCNTRVSPYYFCSVEG